MRKEDDDLIGRRIQELELRKYSFRTVKKYKDVVIRFLKSADNPNLYACGK